MPTRRPTSRLLAVLAAAGLALGGAACGDDDASATATTTTAADTTEGEADATPEGEGPQGGGDGRDDPDDEHDTTTTTEATGDGDDPPPSGDADALAERLAEVPGYDRSVTSDGSGLGSYCDDSEPSVEASVQVEVSYLHPTDDTRVEILAMAFDDAADARTLYDEFVATTSGCEADGITIDEGSPTDIGDEGTVWTLEYEGPDGETGTGAIHTSLAGTEVWLLSQQTDGVAPDQVAPVLDAFAAAVAG